MRTDWLRCPKCDRDFQMTTIDLSRRRWPVLCGSCTAIREQQEAIERAQEAMKEPD